MKKILVMCMLLTWSPRLFAAYHCVVAGLTYNGDGTTWAAASGNGARGAFNALPVTLVRGDTYYIAGSATTYPAYTFTTPVGGTTYITVQKATVSDHGTDTGWQSSYGTSMAEWYSTDSFTNYIIKFDTDYVIFNGVTGGGPGSWDSAFGFLVSTPSNIADIMFSEKYGSPKSRVDVDHITISHTEVTNSHPLTAGWGQGFSATAFYNVEGKVARTSNVDVSYCYVHDFSGNHFYVLNAINFIIEYSHVARSQYSASMHSVLVRFDGCSNATLRYNLFSDAVSTGFTGVYDGSMDGFEVYGNVYYCTNGSLNCGVGDGAIFQNSQASGDLSAPTNWKIYNNDFINLPAANVIVNNSHNGAYNCVIYNNLFHNIPGTPTFPSNFSHDYDWFDKGVSIMESHAQIGNGDPFVGWVTGNFGLSNPTAAGIVLASPYNIDMFGSLRGGGFGWSRGAIQYVFLPPPTNLRIIR